MPSDPSTWLSTVQACEVVGIDRSTLSRYVLVGRIKPVKQLPGRNGAMLFDPADVAALNAWYHHDRLSPEPTEQASA